MRRFVFKKVKPTPSIYDCQITSVFHAENLVILPLSENNSHHTMGSYHLHFKYDDEDSQEVTHEENSSSNITGCCRSHNEDNSEHTPNQMIL